jgi:hypothetical protein
LHPAPVRLLCCLAATGRLQPGHELLDHCHRLISSSLLASSRRPEAPSHQEHARTASKIPEGRRGRHRLRKGGP